MEVYKNIPGFTTGEISPYMSGKVDFDKYHTACERLENFLIKAQGPLVRRPGTRYVTEVKTSSKKTRLITFKFNVTDIRILELGDGYIRVFKSNSVTGVGEQVLNGGSPVEISSPYLEAHIWDIDFYQDADVMYLVHPNFAPRKLSRASDIDWSLSLIKFNPRPSYIANTDLSASCVLGATTGNDIVFTAGSAVFRKADVGRALIMGASRAIITEWTSNTVVKCDIEDDWPSSDATNWTYSTKTIANGGWYLIGSPVADLTISDKGPVGKIVNAILTESGDEHSVTLSVSTIIALLDLITAPELHHAPRLCLCAGEQCAHHRAAEKDGPFFPGQHHPHTAPARRMYHGRGRLVRRSSSAACSRSASAVSAGIGRCHAPPMTMPRLVTVRCASPVARSSGASRVRLMASPSARARFGASGRSIRSRLF